MSPGSPTFGPQSADTTNGSTAPAIPIGLAGEAISLPARILAVADSCDAMMSARRYRQAFAPAQIEAIFVEGTGTQWDPKIVQCFFACRDELYEVCQRGLGQSVYMAVERAAGGGSQVSRASLAVAHEQHTLDPTGPSSGNRGTFPPSRQRYSLYQ